jgi:hypothetical protein
MVTTDMRKDSPNSLDELEEKNYSIIIFGILEYFLDKDEARIILP